MAAALDSTPADATEPAVSPGCTFAEPGGDPCGLPLKARGLCLRHYQKAKRAGAFGPKGQSPTAALVAKTAEGRARLAAMADGYAKLHWMGARVAARKGDTRPAEWALLHSRAVEPVNKEAGNSGPSLVVQVGFALPGLSTAVGGQVQVACLPAATGEVVEAEPATEGAGTEQNQVEKSTVAVESPISFLP